MATLDRAELDIMLSTGHGHRCVMRPSAGVQTTWMPERFQAQAQRDSAALRKALERLTKAQLRSYIQGFGVQFPVIVGSGRKASLVTQAFNLQWSRLYPEREVDSYRDNR